ncbi:MAG: ribose 5-phosphate isomerase B [Rhodospirillales bacterium]
MGAVAIACDHAGLPLKQELQKVLEAEGRTVIDLGVNAADSVDYPDYAEALAKALKDGRAERGVLVCGSGIGMSIAANRHPHIRAALAHDALSAEMTRRHNDANVICFGARMTGADVAKHALKIFLNTEFEGGRHARRVEKLSR